MQDVLHSHWLRSQVRARCPTVCASALTTAASARPAQAYCRPACPRPSVRALAFIPQHIAPAAEQQRSAMAAKATLPQFTLRAPHHWKMGEMTRQWEIDPAPAASLPPLGYSRHKGSKALAPSAQPARRCHAHRHAQNLGVFSAVVSQSDSWHAAHEALTSSSGLTIPLCALALSLALCRRMAKHAKVAERMLDVQSPLVLTRSLPGFRDRSCRNWLWCRTALKLVAVHRQPHNNGSASATAIESLV